MTESVGLNVWLVHLRGLPGQLQTGDMPVPAVAVYGQSLAEFCEVLNVEAPLALLHHAFWRGVATALRSRLPGTRLCYDCMDNHAAFTDESSANLPVGERALVGACDLLIASSDTIAAQLALHSSLTPVVIRNGCEAGFFAGVSAPPLITPSAPPVAIYTGAIAGWFDIDLLAATARLLPDWRFVLAGSTASCDIAAARALPNVTFLGEVPYSQLPALLGTAHVGLIPFRLTELTRATNPVKLYEYLAAGRPVISTALPEVQLYGDWAQVAHDAPGFAAALKNSLRQLDVQSLAARRAFAMTQDWQARADVMDGLFQDIRRG